MEEPRNRYILVQDCVGHITVRNPLTFGLSTKSIPIQVLKGELLEALEQPEDLVLTRIALSGCAEKSLRLECPIEDVARLSSEDADLLLAISVGLRYETFIDRKRLDFGRQLLPGSQVFVSVNGISQSLLGVVRYKGDLPSTLGTMFGVELVENGGLGTSDGTFKNKRYFTCAPDSAVFVGLDKLTPLQDSNLKSSPKSPKRDENSQANFPSRVKDTVTPSFLKGRGDQKQPRERIESVLEIGQRVKTFIKDMPVRGTVCYIGDEKDSSGYVHRIVGLELDKRSGSGTGKLNGKQLFVCRRDYAAFVDIETVIPEKDFDENPAGAATTISSQKKDSILEQIPKGKEPERIVRRTCSDDVADVILTVGESSKMDPSAFIEQQRQMLNELKSSKLSAHIDRDVIMHDNDERTDSATKLRIEEEHLRNTSPSSAVRDKLSIPTDADISETYFDFVHIDRTDSATKLRIEEEHLRNTSPSSAVRDKLSIPIDADISETDFDFVHVDKADCGRFIHPRPHESSRHGGDDEKTGSASKLAVADSSETVLPFLRQQRQSRETKHQLREENDQKKNLQRQLREMEPQLREKNDHKENLQRQLRELEQQLKESNEQEEDLQRQLREVGQQLTNCQGQLQEKDLRETSLQEQLREKELEQENSQRRLREMEQRLTNCEVERAHSEQQITMLERQLRAKDEELNELELSLSTAQQAINEQRRQETCDWVIPRCEIQMTNKCLGRGGWGSVNEGTYCGCTIAVKQIHELILSPHNRRLFEREMNMASRCRHPCLLQFIGATNDEGSPLFVTELMETSLRALLEQRQLSETEIYVISLDVSGALNYLHQKNIVHRDVSSANVLLWRQGSQWRGKVSDYGTANFIQQTMTVAPGALIYSAPEALTSNQTDKVDVYSFGVLLCEMCIRELPEPERREEQVALMTHRAFRGLVRRCLQTDPAQRPNMGEVIQNLEQVLPTSQ